MKRFPLLALLLGMPMPAAAQLEPRLDHLDQYSLEASLVFEQLFVTGRDDEEDEQTPGALVDVAFGIPVGDDVARVLFGARFGIDADDRLRLALPSVVLRTYAGWEEWKTFLDVGAFSRIQPDWALGARLGLGVQYEFSPNLGAFAGAGTSIGYGEGLQIGVELSAGLQTRF